MDANGDPALVAPFVASLKTQLQADGFFQFIDSRDADIALKLSIEVGKQGVRVIAAIVNAKGEVLWPLTPGVRARRYDGEAENVVFRFGNDLLGDLEKLKRRR